MEIPVFTIRHWISIILCLLGFSIPFFITLSRVTSNPKLHDHVAALFEMSYLWLPISSIMWLISAYVFPNLNIRWLGWAIFLLGMFISALFLVIRIAMH
jgi:hypothetical protein